MKFVCEDCDIVMEFVDNQTDSEAGVMKISYVCPDCERSISMVTNPGETQMVTSLGVTIGHEALSEGEPPPMQMVRGALEGGTEGAGTSSGPDPVWSEAAEKRLGAAPTFVQGMVRRLYTDWAKQQGYTEVTPAVMSEARDDLGMAGM